MQQLEDLDGAKFSKMCRDCKLLGRNLTATDVDLIFASSKPKGQRKVAPSRACVQRFCLLLCVAAGPAVQDMQSSIQQAAMLECFSMVCLQPTSTASFTREGKQHR